MARLDAAGAEGVGEIGPMALLLVSSIDQGRCIWQRSFEKVSGEGEP